MYVPYITVYQHHTSISYNYITMLLRHLKAEDLKLPIKVNLSFMGTHKELVKPVFSASSPSF